ncbi:MAG TPA: hypothetical protein VGM94_00450 [Galbitalea sp.]|jgi:hypothetical protein
MQPAFRRRFFAAVLGLAVLVASFAVLTFLQGPRLSSAIVDTTAVVAKPAQTLRMFLNQPVDAVRHSQVSITPAALFTVSSSGEGIVVQFTRALGYGTRYHVAVHGVASADDGQSADLSYGFTTATPDLYYLHRSGTSAPDQIVRTSIHSASQTIVYQARRIQDFAVFDKAIAVVTEAAHGTNDLVFVGSEGEVQQVDLPGAGTIDEMHANRDTGLLGFTFTSAGATPSRRYSDTLFSVDPGGTGIPTVVKGLGGTPMSVLDWFYVPSTSELVAQQVDESIVLIDTSRQNAVTPLGQYPELDSVAADGSAAVASDDLGPVKIALPGGTATRLKASPFGGVTPYLGDAPAVVVPGGWIDDDRLFERTTGRFVDHLVFDTGHTARELLKLPNPRGTIDAFSVSPNGEFAAVETTPNTATSVSDGYAANSRSRDETTDFLDVASGGLVKSVTGFDIQW